jgi:hypothetical protein
LLKYYVPSGSTYANNPSLHSRAAICLICFTKNRVGMGRRFLAAVIHEMRSPIISNVHTRETIQTSRDMMMDTNNMVFFLH